jgi:hypothetical protein
MLASVGGWAVHLGNVGKELNHIIENDHYPLSQRIRVLRSIRAKFPTCATRTATGQTADTPRTQPRARAAFWSAAAFNNASQVDEFVAIFDG